MNWAFGSRLKAQILSRRRRRWLAVAICISQQAFHLLYTRVWKKPTQWCVTLSYSYGFLPIFAKKKNGFRFSKKKKRGRSGGVELEIFCTWNLGRIACVMHWLMQPSDHVVSFKASKTPDSTWRCDQRAIERLPWEESVPSPCSPSIARNEINFVRSAVHPIKY